MLRAWTRGACGLGPSPPSAPSPDLHTPNQPSSPPDAPTTLTKEMQAARRRIRTRRSSNCSTTNSHRDFPGGRGKGTVCPRGYGLADERAGTPGASWGPGTGSALTSSLEQDVLGVIGRSLGPERRVEGACQDSTDRLLKVVGSCSRAGRPRRKCLETSAPHLPRWPDSNP